MKTTNRIIFFIASLGFWLPIYADVEVLVTDSGVPFYFYPMEDAEQVSIQVAWSTDWAKDATGNPAVPYLGAQALLSGGTAELDPAEVLETFRDLNANAAIVNVIDHVRGSLVAPLESIGEAVSIVNTVLSGPRFKQPWIDRLQNSMTLNQEQMNASPQKQMLDMILFATLDDHHLLQSISLNDTTLIGAVTQQELFDWHASTFNRLNSEVVIAGSISVAEASKLVESLFAGLPDGVKLVGYSQPLKYESKSILLHAPKLESSILAMVGELPPTREGGEFEDVVAIAMLGQGPNSELFRAVRTELRSSYAFTSAAASLSRSIRFLQISGEVNADKIAEVREAAISTYDEFIVSGRFPQLEGLVEGISNNLRGAGSNANTMASTILEAVLDGHAPERGAEIVSEFQKVSSTTLSDRLSTSYPRSSQFITFVVSPDRNALPDACVIQHPREAEHCN
jgi:predicted Zn-dependent peptidase